MFLILLSILGVGALWFALLLLWQARITTRTTCPNGYEGAGTITGPRRKFEMFFFRPHQIGMEHISDHDLERYYPRMVKDDEELAIIEGHLLACPRCVERAEESDDYVDTMRAAAISGNLDLE